MVKLNNMELTLNHPNDLVAILAIYSSSLSKDKEF
jgi:hypothetical protein